MRRRRYEVTEMYALIEISNQMLEDSAFDHAGRWAWQVAPQDWPKDRSTGSPPSRTLRPIDVNELCAEGDSQTPRGVAYRAERYAKRNARRARHLSPQRLAGNHDSMGLVLRLARPNPSFNTDSSPAGLQLAGRRWWRRRAG